MMESSFNKSRLLFISWHSFLIGLVCIVIPGLIYWQDILPLRRELATGKQHEQKLTQELQRLYYQETSLEEKMAQLPSTKAMLSEWQKKIIKQNNLDELLKEIMAVSKRDKLRIQLFDSAPISKENNFIRQPFKMVLTGDYSQIARFIGQIANLPWIVVIGNFKFTKLLPDETNQLFSADLEFSVYTRR